MATLKNIRIKRHYSIVVHDENTVELRCGVWNPYAHTLKDETNSGNLFKVIKLLDGQLSAIEIAEKLNLPRSNIESIIDHLQQLGVIEHTASTAFERYIDTCMPILTRPDHVSELNQKMPVTILGDSPLSEKIYELLKSSVAASQLNMVHASDHIWLELQDSNDDWLHDGLLFNKKLEHFQSLKNHYVILPQFPINPVVARRFNRLANKLGISWLFAAVDGPFLFIGPTIVPNIGACYECFETRVMMNMREIASYQKYKEALVAGKVYHNTISPIEPAVLSLVASHTTMEALNFILTECAFTKNKVLSLYLPTMEVVFNEIFRVAGCSTCGSRIQRDDAELYFDVRTLLQEQFA